MKLNFNSLFIFALLLLNFYTIHRVSLFERSNIPTVLQTRKLLQTEISYTDFKKLNHTVITLNSQLQSTQHQLKHLWTKQIDLRNEIANFSSEFQHKIGLSTTYADALRLFVDEELIEIRELIRNCDYKIDTLTDDFENKLQKVKILAKSKEYDSSNKPNYFKKFEKDQIKVNEMVTAELKGLKTAQNNIQNKSLAPMNLTIHKLKEKLKEKQNCALNEMDQLKIQTNETINHCFKISNENYSATMSKINDTKHALKSMLQELSSNSDTTHELVQLTPKSVSSHEYLYSQAMIVLSNKIKEIIYSIQTHTYSISSIVHYFAAKGCGLYLHGGIVRDVFYQVITNRQIQSNDIDFLYTCDANLLYRLCNEHISDTIYGYGQFKCTQSTVNTNFVRVFLNGRSHYYNIDFIPVYDYNLNKNLSMLEMTDYTINSGVYSPLNNALYGIDKDTINDLLTLSIRIPLKSLPKTIDEIIASEDALLWFRRPRKVSRYYKLLMQGYQTNEEIKLFITNVIKLILDDKLKELYPKAKSELISGFHTTSCNLIRGSVVYKYYRNYCIKGPFSRDFRWIPFEHYKEIHKINTYFMLVENDIGTNLTQLLSNIFFEVKN